MLYILFFCGESATSAAIKINSVHGEHTISVKTVHKWFKKLKVRESSPVNFDNDFVKNFVEPEPRLTINQIAERMDLSYGTVFHHLKEIGKVSKLGKFCLTCYPGPTYKYVQR